MAKYVPLNLCVQFKSSGGMYCALRLEQPSELCCVYEKFTFHLLCQARVGFGEVSTCPLFTGG